MRQRTGYSISGPIIDRPRSYNSFNARSRSYGRSAGRQREMRTVLSSAAG
jgi:hypothetical protein